MEKLEKMADFFTARVEDYDKHMMDNVYGDDTTFKIFAEALPNKTNKLLDLGCGTGLELQEIFKRFPSLEVTGVDLTQAMLDKLKEKYADKKLNLVCGDYFLVNFGKNQFDAAVSMETIHHFTKEKKVELYKKIYDSLKENGCYIECDYVAESQEAEDAFFAEYEKLKIENNIKSDEFFHFDTPLTIENQIDALKKAGFKEVEVLVPAPTAILKAQK